MKQTIILLFFAGAILCGCNKQTATKSNLELATGKDSTYMVNKDTGDVFLISGREFIRLTKSNSHEPTNSSVREWTQNMTVQFGTNTDDIGIVSLKHKWRNGAMDYIFTLTPHDGSFRQGFIAGPRDRFGMDMGKNGFYASIKLRFYDSDGFQRRSMTIKLYDTDLADDNGKQVAKQQGLIPCSDEDYQDYKMWSVTWQGFLPLSDEDMVMQLFADDNGKQEQNHDPTGTPLASDKLFQGLPLAAKSTPSAADLERKLAKIQDDLAKIKFKLSIDQ
jgi:hypothetical protein